MCLLKHPSSKSGKDAVVGFHDMVVYIEKLSSSASPERQGLIYPLCTTSKS